MSVPLTGDQKVYLSVALEMRERGEWIIPYLFSEANFLKPPLQYWATLISWNLFGLSIFGAMIPSVLALLASAVVVNRVHLRLTGLREHLPGLLFAASLGTMTYGTTAQMEIWIVLFYLGGWLLYLEQKWTYAFLVVGVMAWVKGPLYPVLWVMSIVFYQFLKRDLNLLLTRRFILNLILGVAVSLIWYALAARTHWQPMLDVFLLKENVAKMQTSHGSPQSLWGEFLYSLFPWLFWLIMGVCSPEGRSKIKEQKYFYLGFALIPALFFTFFPYRVNTYLYLLTPIAALMVHSIRLVRTPITIIVCTLVTLIASAFSVLTLRLTLGHWIGFELGLPLFLVLALWVYFYWRLNLKGIALVSLLLVNLIRVGAVELGEHDLAGLRLFHEGDPAPLAYFIQEKDIWHEYGLVSAALKIDVQRIETKAEFQKFLQQGGVMIFQDSQETETQGLNCMNWPRLRRRIKFPLVQPDHPRPELW